MTPRVWIVEIWLGEAKGWEPFWSEKPGPTQQDGYDGKRRLERLFPEARFRVVKYVRAKS